uniref:palmitoleoyl-protein carboxylesterase notum1-like n=1 Tax=Myxine glutinosa TaxID=7769 RepID=UPI00358E73BF
MPASTLPLVLLGLFVAVVQGRRNFQHGRGSTGLRVVGVSGRGSQPLDVPPPPPQPHVSYQQQTAPDVEESFTLDFTAVEGNVEDFMSQIKNLAQSLYSCSAQKTDDQMKLNFLKNESVTCNDGTPAGYYLRDSKGSKRWLIFLEGGWCCFNKESCDARYNSMRRLMSSTDWPQSRIGQGILSASPEENPHWWNANIVFVPYCSSDVWSGTSTRPSKDGYAFMGGLILSEVVQDLVSKGMDEARLVMLAGTSAGGTGVLLNVDRVADLLEQLGVAANVRGLADSGWFVDSKHFMPTDCIEPYCLPPDAIKRGMKYWNGVVPDSCKQKIPQGDQWKCFFGYNLFPVLQTPVFVVQWLFDEAQLFVDNVHLTGQPVLEDKWTYIHKLGQELRTMLRDVPALFSPSCLSHSLISKSSWTEVRVYGTTLPRALHCWDRSLQERPHGRNTPSAIKGCPFHLVDNCPWPHCNPTCPTMRDHYTGKDMSTVQFLMHLGFDVQRMARQLGIEPNNLLGVLNRGN